MIIIKIGLGIIIGLLIDFSVYKLACLIKPQIRKRLSNYYVRKAKRQLDKAYAMRNRSMMSLRENCHFDDDIQKGMFPSYVGGNRLNGS